MFKFKYTLARWGGARHRVQVFLICSKEPLIKPEIRCWRG